MFPGSSSGSKVSDKGSKAQRFQTKVLYLDEKVWNLNVVEVFMVQDRGSTWRFPFYVPHFWCRGLLFGSCLLVFATAVHGSCWGFNMDLFSLCYRLVSHLIAPAKAQAQDICAKHTNLNRSAWFDSQSSGGPKAAHHGGASHTLPYWASRSWSTKREKSLCKCLCFGL